MRARPCSTQSGRKARPGRVPSIVASIALGFGMVPDAPAQAPSLEREWEVEFLGPARGLPQSCVRALAQSKRGYLWVGTQGGLARYDGARFRVFDVANSPLASNRIGGLAADREGGVWVVTTFGKVSHLPDDEGAAPRRGPEGRGCRSSAIAQAPDGTLHVGSSRFREGRVLDDPRAPFRRPSQLLVDADGVVWASGERGLAFSAGESWRIVDPSAVWSCFAGLGSLWTVAERGLSRVVDEGLQPVEHLGPRPAGPGAALIDHSGRLWWGGRDGLFVGERDPEGRWRMRPGPISSRDCGSVHALLGDRDGNIWVGTRAHGLIRLRPRADTAFALPSASNSRWPRCGTDEDGTLRWTCVYDDRLWTRGDGSPSAEPAWTELVLPEAPGPVQVAIPAAAHGLWVHAGAELLELDATLGRRRSLPVEGRVFDVVLDDRQTLWGLDAEGLFSVPDRAGLRRHPDLFAGPVEEPLSLSLGRGGALFLGRCGGLHRITEEGSESFDLGPGLEQAEVRSVLDAGDDRWWVSTYGHGLLSRGSEGWRRITRAHGLPDELLGRILEDDAGKLWINSNSGVLVLDRRELQDLAEGHIDLLTPHLLPTGEGNGRAGGKLADGRLWFPTVDELVLLDPRRPRGDAATPLASVEGVFADGRPLPAAPRLEIAPGTSSLRFDFTAPHLRSSPLRFRHRLLGRDEEWISDGSARSASYTNLPPGEYRFEVCAGTEEGGWGTSAASVDLRVAAQLHQSPWFRSSMALVTLGLLWFGHRWVLRRIARQKKALEQEAEERRRADQARRAAEAQRELLEEELRQKHKMEAVGQLAAGVAHEFNNLLVGIIGNAELLLDSEESSPEDERREGLEEIRRSGERAATLTRQLLTFSRKDLVAATVFDLGLVLRDAARMLQRLLGERIELRLELAERAALVEADAGAIERAVVNLVLNARDALPDAGVVDLRTKVCDDLVVLEVQDSGCGMSEAVQSRIFEPFFTTKAPGEGTGLGLSTVFADVDRVGGSIEVLSRPEEGTTMRLSFPRARESVPEITAAAPTPTRSGERILVCDDDETVLRVVAQILQRGGYEVSTASRPELALARAREGPAPDLLLTDVIMPGTNGPELAEQLLLLHPQLKVLFMSGYPQAELGSHSAHLCERLEQTLSKPPTTPELLSRIRQELAGRPGSGCSMLG